MLEPFGIALVGCGTVGGGVARLLLEQSERFAAHAGRQLVLRHVVVRDPHKVRASCLPSSLLTTDFQEVLCDPNVQAVVELIGGTDRARRIVLASLEAGKDVVTANKALLAMHGTEIFDAARRYGRAIAFEASVASGIPIITALSQSLAANQILSIQSILNGTCNFILTRMTEQGRSYAEALAEAQHKGYAEADPTLDVNGSDTTHKLAILAQIAFGETISFENIARRGIDTVESADIRFASDLGYVIKLLAETFLSDGELVLQVSPMLLPKASTMAHVSGVFNAVQVTGDVVGDTFFYGEGAGQMPAASAVIGDLIDLAVDRTQRTFQTSRLWRPGNARLKLKPIEAVPMHFYLRVSVEDRPGVSVQIERTLIEQQIGIATVHQHKTEKKRLHLVIVTQETSLGDLRAAVANLDRLGGVVESSVYYPIKD